MFEVMENEPALRLACFAVVLLTMGAWEHVMPRRERHIKRVERWPINVGLAVISTLVVRIVVPVAAVGAAMWAAQQDLGLLNTAGLPLIASFVLALLILDCAIYWQHRLFHKVPWLWRLHRVHHADKELDVTTGVRFHPVEIVLSAIIKIVVVVLIGAPAVSVVIFEIVLNASSMFNHANIRLVPTADALLRKVLVTPDMHRVHHSVLKVETDSNFGFNLPWWDYLFGTYTQQPRDGHLTMRLGLNEFRSPGDQRLGALLLQPLRAETGHETPQEPDR